MLPTFRPAALSTDCVIATTEPLPLVPAYQRAAQSPLGVADLPHEPLDPFEAEADPEAPALGQRRDRLPVGEGQAVSPKRPRRRRSR